MEEINRTAFKIASTQGRELLVSRPAVLRSRQRPDPKGREFFLEREAAEAMIDEVGEDELEARRRSDQPGEVDRRRELSPLVGSVPERRRGSIPKAAHDQAHLRHPLAQARTRSR